MEQRLDAALDSVIKIARQGEAIGAAIRMAGLLHDQIAHIHHVDGELGPEVSAASQHALACVESLTAAFDFVLARHDVLTEGAGEHGKEV